MKKIILHSLFFAVCFVFATSCSKQVKAPVNKLKNTTSTNTTSTNTTTGSQTQNQNQSGHTCGGGSSSSSDYGYHP